ncbi:mitotic checkpoint protein prcc protein [Stemphylium lycopersici]|uniref:Mitotic checkpoint protein prcc protein n=1 Tax=Stemphylium lycopersici TaxID=183478 RepID=A0A364MUT5_STELY|nr:mitotic checkpoint protein prcc protein [Stemphylium lycopersici]RAQ99756.1 mitotic checkpoint protein prcc protein [Stemphylium lycopersici]RAR03770.1 mitotic checkpoint protein prcc protein [Stemphylium lycopersici]
MNLLAGYSDSESDSEAPAPQVAPKPTAKPAFQKVVDRSNPGRIKVNLPGASQSRGKDDIQDDAPPAKKPRLGGGSSFGGFNAMLPAPKKPSVNAIAASESAKTGNRGLGKGLASGVNLKTGAEPAFKREPRAETEEYDETGNPIKKEPMKREDFRAMLNLPPPKSETKTAQPAQETKTEPEPQQAPKPAAPRFVPMSVGKGKKKKAAARPPPASSEGITTSDTKASTPQPPPADTKPRKPKVSLFGVSGEAEPAVKGPSDGQYQPLLYGAEDEDEDAPVPDAAFEGQPINQAAQYAAPSAGPSAPSGLTNIASELNLSEAERRQLFGKKGRSGPDFSGAKVVEFNTDQEYAHNEKLRQEGEAVSHNPLKSISGTGKNSLRSLVNVATTQKDALEDHFAAGHRNKREAGNRYGW